MTGGRVGTHRIKAMLLANEDLKLGNWDRNGPRWVGESMAKP